MPIDDLPPELQEIALRDLEEQKRAYLFYFETDVCTYDPQVLAGWPLGQMHCPICGHMQVAGLPHIGYGREVDLYDDYGYEQYMKEQAGSEESS